jgi:hypothetical protein
MVIGIANTPSLLQNQGNGLTNTQLHVSQMGENGQSCPCTNSSHTPHKTDEIKQVARNKMLLPPETKKQCKTALLHALAAVAAVQVPKHDLLVPSNTSAAHWVMLRMNFRKHHITISLPTFRAAIALSLVSDQRTRS